MYQKTPTLITFDLPESDFIIYPFFHTVNYFVFKGTAHHNHICMIINKETIQKMQNYSKLILYNETK